MARISIKLEENNHKHGLIYVEKFFKEGRLEERPVPSNDCAEWNIISGKSERVWYCAQSMSKEPKQTKKCALLKLTVLMWD